MKMQLIEVPGELGELMSRALGALGSGDGGQMAHERAMEYAISKPRLAKMEPVTPLTATKVNDTVIHLDGHTQKDPEDTHTIFLLKHPTKEKRWRLWNLCPLAHAAVSYRIKGEEADAIRRAAVILDIGNGKIEVTEELLEDEDEE